MNAELSAAAFAEFQRVTRAAIDALTYAARLSREKCGACNAYLVEWRDYRGPIALECQLCGTIHQLIGQEEP